MPAPRKTIPDSHDDEPGSTAAADRRAHGSQAQLALQYTVASILAAADSVDEALPRVLETVCSQFDWDAGAYWAVDGGSGLLRCSVFWQRPALELDLFRSISHEISFAPGAGLPGRVWASGAPAQIHDVALDAAFPRAPMATAGGLRGAICFPVTTAAGVHGVIECFSCAAGELDVDLVRALMALGAQIGQFVERARAEAARSATEMRRASMLETALDAVVTMDHAGRVVEFNPAAERTFGYSREEALGRELADLIIPSDQRARHRAGLARYLATGEGPLIGRQLEVVALRADGSRFPAEVAITRVPLDGAPLFTGYIRDLGERRRMEAALWASEERLHTVVANAPVVLFAVDRDGIFTLSVGAGLAALGIRPDEHVGQSYFALYGHLPGSVAAMRRALAGEHATTVDHYKGLVFETRWMPMRDVGGSVAGVIGVSADITERSRIEEERRRFERRTRAALDALLAMAEVMVRTPSAGDVTASVEAVAHRLADLTRDLLGCRVVGIIAVGDESVPRPLACVGLPADQAEQWHKRIAAWPRGTPLFDALAARLRAGEAIHIDTAGSEHREMANPFGIERYLLVPMRVGTSLVGLLSVDYGPDPDRDREPRDDAALVEGVAGLAALVLERERLQREREEARSSALALREANRRMDEFLGIAGHEMRTPLTSIKASLQLAQRRMARQRDHEDAKAVAAGGQVEVARLLDRAEAQMRRIERLVDDMVDVSRIRAGRLEIRRQRCDLAGIVRDSVDEQRALAPDRQILLAAPAAALLVDADPDRIAQVVINYLTNALKYASRLRPIQVGLASDGVAARVWVRDEGPGLAAEEGERVWELFYRVEGIEHRHGSSVGLGMGLHICRTIVEQHGGRVGVESVPGEGATFWFTLPLAS